MDQVVFTGANLILLVVWLLVVAVPLILVVTLLYYLIRLVRKNLDKPELCPVCKGSGTYNPDGRSAHTCHGCGGRGWLKAEGA